MLYRLQELVIGYWLLLAHISRLFLPTVGHLVVLTREISGIMHFLPHKNVTRETLQKVNSCSNHVEN